MSCSLRVPRNSTIDEWLCGLSHFDQEHFYKIIIRTDVCSSHWDVTVLEYFPNDRLDTFSTDFCRTRSLTSIASSGNLGNLDMILKNAIFYLFTDRCLQIFS